MSYLLVDATSVLVVGESETATERVRSAAPAADIVTVPSVGDALDTLDSQDQIGCVVVLEDPDRQPVEAYQEIRSDYETVPILVFAPESACDVPALASHWDLEYLPTSVDDGTVRGVVDDALARHQDRRREAAESSLFTTLLEDGDVMIYAKDTQGKYLYRADIEGNADPESVIGKTDVEIARTELRERAKEAYRDDMRVVETGEAIYQKVVDHEYGDHEDRVRTTKIPWRDQNGEILGLIGISENITEEKTYERRLKQQANRVDQFIQRVAHDIRTPLQVAYGSLDRARAGEKAGIEKAEEMIEQVESTVTDLHRLSTDVDTSTLSGSSIRSIYLEVLTTDLATLFEATWASIRTGEAELIVDLPEETVIAAETETIRPLVENLLNNAIDRGAPDVTVRVGTVEPRGFYVANDGPTLDEDDRGEASHSETDGTGICLDTVAETVDRLNGEVTVEGDEEGVRFRISDIPVITDADRSFRPTEPISIDENRDIGPVSIPGSAEYDDETDRWTVVGNGTNIWSDTHEFHHVYGAGNTPVRIEARIESLDGCDEFSKAGVTIRSGTDERAPFGYVGTTDAHGSEVIWRLAEDGFTDSRQFEELPDTVSWYRIDYADSIMTCYLSAAGDQWYPVDQRPIELGDDVTVGLLVCSHDSKRTSEAVFTDVRACKLDAE
ncbi:histidine kinase [Halobacteriales archaeon QS_4_62_28]|nr:MAG: histidine kinase [Halobacteriales archaeon QS_4_62_28]